MDDEIWLTLPHHILVQIFSCLSQNDRLTLSLVCKSWAEVFHDSQLWSHFVFKFDTNNDAEGKALVCAERYNNELKDVELLVNQSQEVSRKRAVAVVDSLIEVELWKLTRFKFGFTGENPLCFNGNYILDKVKDLLRSIKDKDVAFDLRVIDLSRMNIALDDSMLNILSELHLGLRVVHIQNYCLVDNITAEGVLKLVKSCKRIEELYAFFHCITDDVIDVLSNNVGRATLNVLSLMCNRSDKYTSMVSSDAWASLKKSNPDLELIMKFHSTMPRHMINPILCHPIPVTKIDLHIYCWLDEEVQHIADVCNTTLRSLSCYTSLDPNDKANEALPPALLQLASRCDKLTELHCHCILPQDTIDQINTMCDLNFSTLYSSRIFD
ncbi:F-box/LRR-repeat protein 8-like [Styela clava]